MPARKTSTVKPHNPVRTVDAGLDFTALVDAIQRVHKHTAAMACRAVNVGLTQRNWVIGAYIHHYQLNGADRAAYGARLLDTLAEQLQRMEVSNSSRRQLYRYLRFYRFYPGIGETLSAQFRMSSGLQLGAAGSTPESGSGLVGTASPHSGAAGEDLVDKLSYSHLELIVDLDDPLKRAFYARECIRGNWSVRELKRQIVTLYFERSGLSKDKEKLAGLVQQGVMTEEPELTIRDPYIFEFLGLRAQDVMGETDLEAALVDHLREFLLELGHGFCLEAQQKSILIGRTRGFVDLVFYHRILKCHVLLELKVDEFRHEHIGQLNTYVTWYRKHMMAADDNPPVGILLCTEKDHALVEYATASMDNQLFVSKYAVELPSKAALAEFLETHYREITGTSSRGQHEGGAR